MQEDGTFTFELVPPGTYTLEVSGAQDVADPDELDQAKLVLLRDFEDANVAVVVVDGDVNAPDILLKQKVKSE